MAVEVAIGALGRAERPVDVDAEAGDRGLEGGVRSRFPRVSQAGITPGEFLEGAGAVRQRRRLPGFPAVLLLRRHLAEGAVADRAETPDRSRSRSCRAAARPDALRLAAEIFGLAVRPGEADDGDEAPGARFGSVAPASCRAPPSFSIAIMKSRAAVRPFRPVGGVDARLRRRARRRPGRNRPTAPAGRWRWPPRSALM
jgi:hypothetical protein